MNKFLAAVAVAAGFVVCGGAYAADEVSNEEFEERHSGAAVSEINAKVAIGYAHFDFNDVVTPFPGPTANPEQDGIFVEGSLSIPVGQQFGFQLDVAHADLDDDVADMTLRAVGGHFFWRDPSNALLGVYAEHKEYGDLFESQMIAFEGELYRDQYSFEFLAGSENLETPLGDSDFFVGEAMLAFYPTENTRLHAGVRRRIETTSFLVGFEHMIDRGGVSPTIFADAAFGGDDTTSVMGGLRLYIGSASKSLVRRHREDDPQNRLTDGIDAVGTCLNDAISSQFTGMGPRVARAISSSAAVRAPRRLMEPVFEDCELNFSGPMYGGPPT